jgi:hypothetical protein
MLTFVQEALPKIYIQGLVHKLCNNGREPPKKNIRLSILAASSSEDQEFDLMPDTPVE